MMMILSFFALLVVSVTCTKVTDQGMIDDILSFHNLAREKVHQCKAVLKNGVLQPPASASVLADLEWDDDLAKTASDYANTCGIVTLDNGNTKKANGACAHSSTLGWKPSGGWAAAGFSGGVGENIGCPTTYSFGDDIVHAWLDTSMIDNERKNYRWKKYSDTNCWNSGKGAWTNKGCGHYTQITWGATRTVGCGWANCKKRSQGGVKDGTWMVCQYYPSGNYKWTYPYEPVGTCSGSGNVVTTTKNPADCVDLSGFSSSKYTKSGNRLSDLNGRWCLSGTKKYTKEDGSLSMNWSNLGEWNVGNNWMLYGWCGQSNIYNCDGKWTYQNTGGKYTNAGSSVGFDTVGGSAAATQPSPTPKPTTKPPTQGSSSSGRCVQISGMPGHSTASYNNYLPDMNGKWYETGSNTNVYEKSGISLDLKYLSSQGQWRVGNGWKPWGYCTKGNILNCDGKWKYKKSGESTQRTASNTQFTSCGALELDDYPCYYDFASAFKFYLNDSHVGLHFRRVDAAGCYNDAPQWAVSDFDSSSTLLLKYEQEEWHIYDESSYMYQYPKYVCVKHELEECGKGWWQQLVQVPVEVNATDEVVESDDAEFANITLSGDVAYDIEFVTLTSAVMVPVETVEASSSEKTVVETPILIAICALVVLAVVATVAACCVVRRKRNTTMKHMEAVADDDHEAGEAGATAETNTMM